jgi:phage terminase large subunit-like protein
MDITLHPDQLTVFHDPARFKVCAAGRRFGKSYLAAVMMFVEASKNEKTRSDGVVVDLQLEKVYYVAPTFTQGKEIIWPLLKEVGRDLIQQSYENNASITLINGRVIAIKGADKPDSLRGTGLSFVVLDEYAFMKEEVWEKILRPQLARSEGGALFIGTPDGKNHFYDMHNKGKLDTSGRYTSFTFHSAANPHLPQAEIDEMAADLSEDLFRQEMEASFEASGGKFFSADMFTTREERPYGDIYIAIDLAGFTSTEGGRRIEKLDDHAIAVVLNHSGGWHIVNIIHGQWDTRETALRIMKAYKDYRPSKLGIEKGIGKNAVMPYLTDLQHQHGTYFTVWDLTHGNKHKADRVQWAMQGRAEKGRITIAPDGEGERDIPWNRKFIAQAIDFPSTIAHDDLIDAVSYIDQLAEPWFDGPDMIDEWVPLDDISGY